MTYEEKRKLARTGDYSKEAAALRLRAAREATGLSQPKLGKEGGVGKAAISNAEKAAAYPNRSVLVYLYREHRIDFNFMIHGDFNQLPQDVQEKLFDELAKIERDEDQTAG